MYKLSARLLLVLSLTSSIALPSYARGFGGGFGGFHGGGGGFGGFHGGGDFHGGAAGHYGGFGGQEVHPSFGGGFNEAGAGRGVMTNHPNYGAAGGAYGHAGQFPNHSQFPTDGGFGNISGERVPQNFDKNSFNGNSVNRGNFNNDTYNKNVNVNNINSSGYHNYGGYHANGAYGGYHPYGGYGGYHPYGGYGYGYNPTAMMWTYAGISSLTTLTSFLGMSAIMGASGGGSNKQPASYSNVTYNGGNVYVNGQPSGTSSDFYKQAQQLAASAYNTPYVASAAAAPTAVAGTYYPGMPEAAGVAPGVATAYGGQPTNAAVQAQAAGEANSADWKPLGTFSLAEAGQTRSNMMLQLDINKDGILHGTYYNQLTMETSQVYGALDKATQRISWTIGTNPSTVFDAGLGDLIKDESSVLVHYGPTNTQRMALIRLKQAPPGLNNGTPGQGAPEAAAPVQPG